MRTGGERKTEAKRMKRAALQEHDSVAKQAIKWKWAVKRQYENHLGFPEGWGRNEPGGSEAKCVNESVV